MKDYLKPNHRVLEWGGGGSTMFFLDRGCHLTTVESSGEWVTRLEAQVNARGSDARRRWDLRYVALSGNSDPAIADYVGQVAVGGPWDLVLVDGWSRLKCLRAANEHVKPGGVLVLDNADQAEYRDASSMVKPWEHLRFRGLGVARSWITQTDAYVRPA